LSQAFIRTYAAGVADPSVFSTEDVGVFHQAFFANILGCFLMGILVQFKPMPFFQRNLNLFVGLGTGGLGSLTTFGSWNEEVSIKFYQQRKVFNGIFSLFFGFISSYGAYFAGRDLGHLIIYLHDKRMKKVKQKRIKFSSVPNPNNVNINNMNRDPNETLDIESMDEETQLPHATKKEERDITIFAFVSYITVTILLVALAIPGTDYNYTVASLVGSTGAVLRYYMIRMNPRVPNKLNFPLFTFLVNIIGSVIASLVILFTTPDDVILRAALSTGFTGCLTTVSTFVDELSRLETWQAWIYGVLSLFGAQLLLTFVNMSYIIRSS
jgi:fluoride ion exporter CrcB/FEX